jgi:O-antigen/teichoic acid export membrane protein
MLKRLVLNQEVMRYVKNSAWMLAEYGLKVISAILVTIYVARYLGPDQFGVLSYALAVVAIVLAISRLGMESILVRDLVRYPEKRQEYMATAFRLMLLSGFVGIGILAGMVYWLEENIKTQVYIWIISASIVCQAFLVVDYNFQSQVQAKYSSIAKSLALIFSALSKIGLVWLEADLFYFALFYAIDHLVIAITLFFMHWSRGQPLFFHGFQKKLVKPLLSSAWPMVVSAVSAILYTRVDQLMIRSMLGFHELGLYVAATKIYEGWIIVPYVISISLLPAILRLKEEGGDYEKHMSLMISLLFWPSVVVALIITISSDYVIYLTFGPDYFASSNSLVIIMWASIFGAIGSLSARFLTVEGMESKIAKRGIFGLLLNLMLNVPMIYFFGIEGAAFSTLITMFFIFVGVNYIDPDCYKLRSIVENGVYRRG